MGVRTSYVGVVSIVAFALCVLTSFDIAMAQTQQRPKLGIVGQQAPAWKTSSWHQLPSDKKEKETLDITDYKDKVVYLYFFQSWCPGCHSKGFPTLKKVSDELKDNDKVAFVAIQTTFEGHSVNTADKLKTIAERYKLKIPFGQSAGKSGTPEIMQKYRTGGTPWVVIIDRQGRVVHNGHHVDADRTITAIKQLAGK